MTEGVEVAILETVEVAAVTGVVVAVRFLLKKSIIFPHKVGGLEVAVLVANKEEDATLNSVLEARLNGEVMTNETVVVAVEVAKRVVLVVEVEIFTFA